MLMKSLSFLTHQEIYNASVKHLLEQGRTALLARGGGAYRGYCGGCPVGRFISARDYLSAIEGVPVRNIIGSNNGQGTKTNSNQFRLSGSKGVNAPPAQNEQAPAATLHRDHYPPAGRITKRPPRGEKPIRGLESLCRLP
jgi:hypothetical protein